MALSVWTSRAGTKEFGGLTTLGREGAKGQPHTRVAQSGDKAALGTCACGMWLGILSLEPFTT